MSFSPDQVFVKTIAIDASPDVVWSVLTNPTFMCKWMFDSDIEIITDWKVGAPITIRAETDSFKPGF